MAEVRSVKEWQSPDVVARKYGSCWTIVEAPDGKLTQIFVREGGWDAQNRFFLRTDKELLFDHSPVYYPVDSGYYVHGETSFLLTRRFSAKKTYSVGVHHYAWKLEKVNSNGQMEEWPIDSSSKLDLLNPPSGSRFTAKGIGVINRRYFASPHAIFYKGNPIGVREKTVILLDNKVFTKDLQRVMGPQWQIS